MSRLDWSKARTFRDSEPAAEPEPRPRVNLNARNRRRWGKRPAKADLRQAGADAVAAWEARKEAGAGR